MLFNYNLHQLIKLAAEMRFLYKYTRRRWKVPSSDSTETAQQTNLENGASMVSQKRTREKLPKPA